MKEKKPRPMTSYRHASAQRMLLKGSSLDDVAMKMNTSKEMIQRVYAHSSNEHFSITKTYREI